MDLDDDSDDGQQRRRGGSGGDIAGDDDADEHALPPARLALADVGPLTALLQAIRIPPKQVATVTIAPDGVWLRWEDDAKTLQASVQLRSELFASFDAGGATRAFGLQLARLVDTLAVFASGAARCPLALQYPGPDGELLLEAADGGGGAAPPLSAAAGATSNGAAAAALDAAPAAAGRCVMYARLATLERAPPADLADYWQGPASSFLVPPALLKEAVEDLEWAGGAVALRLERDPPLVGLSAHGGPGALEVRLPADDLPGGVQVALPVVLQRYKHKNLRAAMCHVHGGGGGGGERSSGGGAGGTAGGAAHHHGGTGGLLTKVAVDANGLLRVTHMVALAPAARERPGAAGGGAGGPFGGSLMQPSALLMTARGAALGAGTAGGGGAAGTQGDVDPARLGVVQFVTLPVEERDDDAA